MTRKAAAWLAGTVVVLILAALYFSGRLDYTLYPLGLNFHQCAKNGFGATFCGSDLTAYENRIRGVQQQFQRSEKAISQQEQQAQQQAAQEQQTLTQQECQADPQLSICPSP